MYGVELGDKQLGPIITGTHDVCMCMYARYVYICTKYLGPTYYVGTPVCTYIHEHMYHTRTCTSSQPYTKDQSAFVSQGERLLQRGLPSKKGIFVEKHVISFVHVSHHFTTYIRVVQLYLSSS